MSVKSFFRRKFKKKKIRNYISKSSDLGFLKKELSKSPVFGIDTEFDWKTTYFPKLSIVQISTINNIFVLDFLKFNKIDFFKKFIEDKNYLKVFHSVRSDAIVLSKSIDCNVKNVFDIQIAEKILSEKEIMSYGKIVNKYFGIQLDKTETNSNWLSRPLTQNQINYAAEDVDYLIEIFEIQKKILSRKNFLVEAFLESEKEAKLGNQPLVTSRLTKNLKKLNKRGKEIFLWREKIAENRNIPPNYVFREKYISDLSKIFPNVKLAKKNAMKILGDSEITKKFLEDFL